MYSKSGNTRRLNVLVMNGTAQYSDVFFDVIRRRYGPLKNAAKLLARAAGCSPRTAENYLAGTHAPSGDKLINLLADCQELADEINKLIAQRRITREGNNRD